MLVVYQKSISTKYLSVPQDISPIIKCHTKSFRGVYVYSRFTPIFGISAQRKMTIGLSVYDID